MCQMRQDVGLSCHDLWRNIIFILFPSLVSCLTRDPLTDSALFSGCLFFPDVRLFLFRASEEVEEKEGDEEEGKRRRSGI